MKNAVSLKCVRGGGQEGAGYASVRLTQTDSGGSIRLCRTMGFPSNNKPGRMGPLRLAALVAVTLWGMYFVTLARTMAFGLGSLGHNLAGEFLIFLVAVFPFAALILLGRRWRTFNLGVVTVALVCIIFAETFATSQEVLVLRHYGQNPGQKVFVERWAPFAGHCIYYEPGTGWAGTD